MKTTQYYILNKAAGTNGTGKVYPQSQRMRDGYFYKSPNSCWNITWNKLPNFNPDLNYFVLEKKAKLTDVISAVSLPVGYLMNDRTKNVITQFKLPKHQFYSASVMQNSTIFDNYNLFLHVGDISENIDYQNSEFQVLQINEVIETFCVNSKVEFENKKASLSPFHKINALKIALLNEENIDTDVFLLNFDTRTYISHRLKTALEEAHITGIEIVPTDII